LRFLVDQNRSPRLAELLRRGDGLVNTSRCRVALRGVSIVISTIVFATVLTGCGGPRDERAAWVLVASSPDSSTIRVQAGFGGCSTFLRTYLNESARSVSIDVIVHTTDDNCKAILYTKVLDVALQAPLGERTIKGECDGPEGTVCFALHASAPPASGS
jgi:hypothetical protein